MWEVLGLCNDEGTSAALENSPPSASVRDVWLNERALRLKVRPVCYFARESAQVVQTNWATSRCETSAPGSVEFCGRLLEWLCCHLAEGRRDASRCNWVLSFSPSSLALSLPTILNSCVRPPTHFRGMGEIAQMLSYQNQLVSRSVVCIEVEWNYHIGITIML